MGTRILVQCRSQAIPGKPNQRSDTMANIICQHRWHRDFDKSQDRIRSTGQYAYDNNRCIFVVDNGPPDSKNVSVSMYTWDGGKLTEMPISPIVKSHLQHYPFNPANASPGYTDNEYREAFGEEAYNHLVMGRILQRRKWGQKLPDNEVKFLKSHPELDTEA